jgi:hypothetical protein
MSFIAGIKPRPHRWPDLAAIVVPVGEYARILRKLVSSPQVNRAFAATVEVLFEVTIRAGSARGAEHSER